MKKLMSIISAIGIISSLAISPVLTQAEEIKPSVVITDNGDYNKETGIGSATISIVNLDKITLPGTSKNLDDYELYSVTVSLDVDSDNFDTSYYTSGRGGQIGNNISLSDKLKNAGATATLGSAASASGMYVTIPVAGTACTGSVFTSFDNQDDMSKCDIATIKYHAKNNNVKFDLGYATMELGLVNATGNGYSEQYVYGLEGSYLPSTVKKENWVGTVNYNPDIFAILDEPELYDENGKVYDEDGDTVFADGENDNAVAYVKSLSGVQGSKVSFAGTFTKANGDTVAMKLKAPKSLDAVIETAGDVVLGLIVQFGAEYTDFALDADSIVIE